MMDNTRIGIQFAQEGRKIEALAYLRRAVMSEAVNAEVWLWLAHVSPDPLEYRNCVQQALALQPDHPTASRMQQDIELQDRGMPPPILATDAANTLAHPHKRQMRWRRILLLLLAIVGVSLCGIVGNAALRGVDQDQLDAVVPFLEPPEQTIQFSVENEQEIFNFVVGIPKGWLLADSGSPRWRNTRDQLQRQFPTPIGTPSLWRALESDFGKAARDPRSGEFTQPIAIVETDPKVIEQSPDIIAHMVLIAVRDLPQSYPDNSCSSLRQLAEDQRQTTSQSSSFVDLFVREQAEGECIYVREYRSADEHFFQLAIPVENRQIALWDVKLPQSLYQKTYRSGVEQIINSLQYRSTSVN